MWYEWRNNAIDLKIALENHDTEVLKEMVR